MNKYLVQLKLYAFEAIGRVEAKAREAAVATGKNLTGPEKFELAVKSVMLRYAELTASIPGLNATDVDDKFVEREVRKIVQKVFDLIGDALNKVAAAPVVDAPGLPKGGVK